VLGEALGKLPQAVGIEYLQGLHDLVMQGAPVLLEQAPVGHLTGEGVLEGVDLVREELRLTEELLALKVHQAALQHVFRQPHQPLQ
jgi:hypothetical protein